MLHTNSKGVRSSGAAAALLDGAPGIAIPRGTSFWRRLLAFSGPAYMVSVGYMDPGNWATDIEGGSRFAYELIWVLLASNLMAVLLQTLSARLGIVTGRDLAQCCRDAYPRPVALGLWALSEVAIAACDLAEVLGTAIGLNLLLGIPLLAGVVLTALDVLLLLAIQRLGIRLMEGVILALIATIGACYVVEIFLARPDWVAVLHGFRPHLANGEALYVAIGIIGATVMPHNLYLHSALVQTRQVERSERGMREANRMNLIDSGIALNCAFFVNAAILILAAATFNRAGKVVTEIQQAHSLLEPLLGTSLAGLAFAVGLLAAGQSSTLTGTLAGQVVMEGFLEFRMKPHLRRLLTRSIAIIPAVVVIAVNGDQGSYRLLILSQVILSLQLPFAIVPLIQFTSDRKRMGDFASGWKTRTAAWFVTLVIVAFNGKLVVDQLSEAAGTNPALVRYVGAPVSLLLSIFLVGVALLPALRRAGRPAPTAPRETIPRGELEREYRRIAIALAAEPADEVVLAHGLSIARRYGAGVLLIHVAEGFGPRYFGRESDDAETRADRRYLEEAKARAARLGVPAKTRLLYGDPAKELAALIEEDGGDLLVMGAHGHKWFGDIIFGSTVDPVRHRVRIPVLVVRSDAQALPPAPATAGEGATA